MPLTRNRSPMNTVLRGISVMLMLLLLASCGGSSSASESAGSGGSVKVPADRPMQDAMGICVGIWMEEVSDVPTVVATLGDPGVMSRITLEKCGNERIRVRGIAAGFACNPDGCYAEDKHGFDWTTAARKWACDHNRPEVCAKDE